MWSCFSGARPCFPGKNLCLAFLGGPSRLTTQAASAVSARYYIARMLLFSSFPIVAYLLWNYVRFGSVTETGYSLITAPADHLRERVDHYGVFSYHYFIFNSLYMFLNGFSFSFSGPDALSKPHLDAFGTSLTFAKSISLFFLLRSLGETLSHLCMVFSHPLPFAFADVPCQWLGAD